MLAQGSRILDLPVIGAVASRAQNPTVTNANRTLGWLSTPRTQKGRAIRQANPKPNRT